MERSDPIKEFTAMSHLPPDPRFRSVERETAERFLRQEPFARLTLLLVLVVFVALPILLVVALSAWSWVLWVGGAAIVALVWFLRGRSAPRSSAPRRTAPRRATAGLALSAGSPTRTPKAAPALAAPKLNIPRIAFPGAGPAPVAQAQVAAGAARLAARATEPIRLGDGRH
jgi:hypothetical protein